MKILQLSSASSFGGGERYVADLANTLQQRGHDLFVALRPRSPLLEHLQLPAAQLKTLPLRNALDVQSARELAQFVRQHEIEIVHAHMARDYSLAAYAARRGNAKFIVTRHVLFPLSRFHWRTLARATRVIAVSNAVARELRKVRLTSDERIAVIQNGVDVDRFARARAGFVRADFLRRLGVSPESLLVGSIGELRTLKRHDDFIRAAAVIAAQFPNAHFVLAGVDPERGGDVQKQLNQLVDELALRERFHFLGWVDEAEELLCAIDVFVSASETESFGLAIAEAMAAGAAVVATATEGAREVIEEQQTGLLVPIGDVARIAAAVASLLGDEERRSAMGARAQDAVKARFSLKRMVDQIEAVYLA